MKRVALLARIPDRLAHLPSTSSQIFLSTRRNHAEAVLSRHDLALINRGDFTGVKPSNMKPERENLPDNVIAKLQEQVTRNSRISGENFMKGILLPLEAGVSQPNGFAEAFKRSSDRFGPFALSLCGKVMPDIPSDQRAILMGRLWTTYEKLNIPITRAVFNQRLAIWVENSHDFDPLETLNDMELKYQLEPDVTTFNLLLKRLAFSEKIGNIEKWTLKMAERGVLPNMETECMKVMCNATARRYDATDEAITSALIKHGEPARSKAMGAALIGTVIARDMERLRSLLRQAVIVFKSEKHVLGVEYKDIFDRE
ncbi:hypothetical protein L596_028140 [Steinernema carpocapsae]|uniref:Pentacotripeptide-repeat region of PRORP domain-containing protein n=1 Tax=Steinernema carpocapsae TaxID=34508 RepID=A0A4U5LXN5_STECR|nr:hypothetical protein L596_028140 [Steinernema carpocapsae]